MFTINIHCFVVHLLGTKHFAVVFQTIDQPFVVGSVGSTDLNAVGAFGGLAGVGAVLIDAQFVVVFPGFEGRSGG